VKIKVTASNRKPKEEKALNKISSRVRLNQNRNPPKPLHAEIEPQNINIIGERWMYQSRDHTLPHGSSTHQSTAQDEGLNPLENLSFESDQGKV
jgi:hypothetical protein